MVVMCGLEPQSRPYKELALTFVLHDYVEAQPSEQEISWSSPTLIYPLNRSRWCCCGSSLSSSYGFNVYPMHLLIRCITRRLLRSCRPYKYRVVEWRKVGDSNPSTVLPIYSLSRRAPSPLG